MQDGGHQHKWKERSRIRIYLGRSPDHARNVVLVLDRTTDFVFPQYHIKLDRAFGTVQDKIRGNLDLNWQVNVVLVLDRTTDLVFPQYHIKLDSNDL